jgi:hypothetical protein
VPAGISEDFEECPTTCRFERVQKIGHIARSAPSA